MTSTAPGQARHRRPKISKGKRARIRLAVYERDGYTCADCGWQPGGIPEGYDGTYALAGPAPAEALSEPGRHPSQQLAAVRILTLGHKVHYRDGGPFTEGNLKAQCSYCNYQKGAR
jgi:HNH endonuclease